MMDHEPHVGLVDPHTKGVGGHDDAGAVLLPGFLALLPFGGAQTGMIEVGREMVFAQKLRDFLRAFPVAHIDDGRTRYTVENVYDFFVLILRSPNYIMQIITVIRYF